MQTNLVNSPRGFTNSVATDVEYEISRCFMNYTRDQLLNKQFAIMIESNNLLDSLIKNSNKKINQSFDKDFSAIISNNTLDTLMTQEDQQPKSRKLFTRKTAFPSQILNRTINNDFSMGNALEEIRQSCSAKTFETVNKLFEDFNKMKKSMAQSKRSQQLNLNKTGIIRTRPDTDRNSSDQSFILTTRNQKLQRQNCTLSNKIQQLQGKVQQLNNKLTKNKKQHEQKMKQLMVPNYIQQYLKNRQQRLEVLNKKIESTHRSILQCLQTTLIEEGCSRCCQLVRKIKDSLANYKICLTQEIEDYKQLWEQTYLQNKNKSTP